MYPLSNDSGSRPNKIAAYDVMLATTLINWGVNKCALSKSVSTVQKGLDNAPMATISKEITTELYFNEKSRLFNGFKFMIKQS